MAGARALSDDPARVSAVLATDRAWGAYLLADLEPPLAAHARWFVAHDAPAVVLLYDAFDLPVFTLFGPAEACAPLFEAALAAAGSAEGFVACGHEHRALVERRAAFDRPDAMFRMRLERACFDAAGGRGDDPRVVPLTASDLPALRALHADGAAAGEAPDFFLPSMLDDGAYVGVREGAALVAAAGTHVVARAARVAAVGNVYVRRERRGAGLGRAVTAGVVAGLLARGIATVVLNVRRERTDAVHVYGKLGFVVHRPFLEGRVAVRGAAC